MRGWGLPWLVLGLAGAATGPGTEPSLRLQAEAPVTRTLASGEVHLYELTLDQGDYLRLEVVQQGLDVKTVVRGPSGEKIVEVDFPTGRFSTENVSLVAEQKGEYEVEVRASSAADAGGYRLILEPLRAAGDADRLRLRAERASFEAGKGVEAARRALELWQSVGDRVQEARALSQLARALSFSSNQTAESLASFERALSVQRELRDREGLAETLRNQGRLLKRIGESRRALEALQESSSLWQEVGRPDLAAIDLLEAGNVQRSLGDSEAALDAYQQGLELSRKMDDKVQQAQALNALGRGRIPLGQAQQALDDLGKALELARGSGRTILEAEILSNLGDAYQSLGMPHDALEHFARAREILHAQKDSVREAIALNNLGNLLFQLGALEEARDLLEQSLPLQQDPANKASTLMSLSRIAEELGDLKQASALNEKALQIQRDTKNRAGEAESLRTQGLLLLKAGKPVEAETKLRESLSIYGALGHRSRAAIVRSGLARALADGGQTEEARQAYEQSRQESAALGDVGSQAATLAEQGRLEHLAGCLPAARQRLKAALDLLESFRSQVGGDSLRALNFAAIRETYERYVDVLMQLHRADPKADLDARALEVAEQSRARGLLDVLGHARVDTRDGNPELIQHELGLRQELNAKATLRLTLADDEASRTRREALDKEIDALTTEHQIVESRLTAGSTYQSLRKPSLSIREIQSLLDDQTVLLEYLLGETRSYLWVVGPTSLKSYDLPGRQAITERARSLHEHLKDPAERDVAGQRSDLRVLAQEVLGPALGDIEGKRLIVVPDGALHYIPFAALQVPSKAGTLAFLIEEHEIGVLPSAAVLQEIRRAGAGRERRPASIAVLANPTYDGTQLEPRSLLKEIARGASLESLPWTQQEAQDIAAEAQGREVLIATGSNATRALVTSGSLQPYRALHFATHGILDSEHPEQSGLVLSQRDAQGNPIDGFLSLQDLYALHLQADLVVLSGCDTGLGRELRGEGLVGLTHGFLHAGASQVVASLWPVRDLASAELMRTFYRSMLRDGMRPAAALRAAQIEMLSQRTRNRRDPYYWAAFVAQGDWTSGL